MSRQIVVDLVSDAADYERQMRRAAEATEKFDDAVADAADQSEKFGRSADDVADGLGTASGKLRDTNDLVTGFADVVGLSLPPQAQMIMGFADMADGLAGALLPALSKAQPAMKALNATMRANPFLTVVTVLAALSAAFVVAYKKSETFRAIVDGTLSALRKAFKFTVDAIEGYIGGVVNVYRSVFNGIADAWNNTVGRLSFKIPGWVPGIGGNGWEVPDIPKFATGGRFDGGPMIVGERGPEMLIPDGPGTIVPNGRAMNGPRAAVDVNLRIDGGMTEMRDLLRKIVKVNGGTVEGALG